MVAMEKLIRLYLWRLETVVWFGCNRCFFLEISDFFLETFLANLCCFSSKFVCFFPHNVYFLANLLLYSQNIN